MEGQATPAQTTALWCAAFFDELVRCGVRQVVISPGSRSTPLAMAAFELSCRRPNDLEIYVDVDERGAAFFGLGMAKAQGRPVACVCTSGTATANYYPAVLEAETSRVPLLLLTGDRPQRLQGLGAPQTTDQLKLFGSHVRAFRALPLPSARLQDIAFVRQAAFEAVLAATGSGGSFAERAPEEGRSMPGAAGEQQPVAGCDANAPAGGNDVQVASRGCERLAGPVHVNVPFDEPFTPDFEAADAYVKQQRLADDSFSFGGRRAWCRPAAATSSGLSASALGEIEELLAGKRVLVLAGEGTCSSFDEAREVAAWANRSHLPLLADPLSGLRSLDDPAVIDSYDAVFGRQEYPEPQAVIRFGRYPVSKRTTSALAKLRPLNLVVDVAETRDYNAATDLFVPLTPLEFVRATAHWQVGDCAAQRAFLQDWISENDAAFARIAEAARAHADKAPFESEPLHEGAVLQAILQEAPDQSCLFAANSMTVRNVDTFLRRSGKPLCVLANRGQNGIDGTLSSAIGAAQHFRSTTFVTGDLTLQHDMNAFALQNELREHHGNAQHSLVVVLLNNNGGAIFDMLPQASEKPYFQRLFLTPQNVSFEHVARAFEVPYFRAQSIRELKERYRACVDAPGISLIEVAVPLRKIRERLGECWS